MMQNDTEQTLDTIAAMCHQEQTAYRSIDYLSSQPFVEVDRSCRTKMAAWCHQVVEFCKFQRESVEIAMSLVDRFVAVEPAALRDRNVYQLACMTCLYTSIKIHEHMAIHSNVITQLSQGTYSIAQVEAMEQRILSALQWRVNPPTTCSFARLFCSLLDVSDAEQATILRLTQLQCESAVTDYRFITVPASTIAYAALLNALESLGGAVHHTRAISSSTHLLAGQRFCPQKLASVRTCLLEALVGEQNHNNSGSGSGSSMCSAQSAVQHRPCSSSLAKQLMRRTSESSPRSVVRR